MIIPQDIPSIILIAAFACLSILLPLRRSIGLPARAEAYIKHLWTFILVFVAAQFISFAAALCILAVVCFLALREYFSLLDIRLQDRWGLWGAYAAIPFMAYFIQIDWYGMFIISIPLYTFMVIPFFIVLGGKEMEGTVFSIGAIDLGLFLFVFCAGHIGYLLFYSTWLAVLLLIDVSVCDGTAFLLSSLGKNFSKGEVGRYLVSIPFTALISYLFAGLTKTPAVHAVVIGALIPPVVAMGRYIMFYIESDLGIAHDYESLRHGRFINSSSSLMFAAPIMFHYIRYFLK